MHMSGQSYYEHCLHARGKLEGPGVYGTCKQIHHLITNISDRKGTIEAVWQDKRERTAARERIDLAVMRQKN